MRPILFEIRLFNTDIIINSYISFSIIAVISGIFLAYWIFRRNNLKRYQSLLGILVVSVPTVLGARIFSVLFDTSTQINLDLLFRIRFGEFSVFGGLVFGLLSGYLYLKLIKKDALRISDKIVYPIGIGLILWRTGCFLNGCCRGIPTDSFFGVTYPGQYIKVYPTQLFEVISVVLALLAVSIIRIRSKKAGIITLVFYYWFAVSYSIILFFRETGENNRLIQLISPIILLLMITTIAIVETLIIKN